jgi:hypothetical protein
MIIIVIMILTGILFSPINPQKSIKKSSKWGVKWPFRGE